MRPGYNALLGLMYDQHPLQKDLLVHYTPHDLLLCQLHYQMDQLWWSWQIDRMALYELLCHCWDKYDIINHQLAQQHLILSLPGSERWIFLCNFSSRVVCVIRKKLIWTLLGAIKKIFKSIGTTWSENLRFPDRVVWSIEIDWWGKSKWRNRGYCAWIRAWSSHNSL